MLLFPDGYFINCRWMIFDDPVTLLTFNDLFFYDSDYFINLQSYLHRDYFINQIRLFVS